MSLTFRIPSRSEVTRARAAERRKPENMRGEISSCIDRFCDSFSHRLSAAKWIVRRFRAHYNIDRIRDLPPDKLRSAQLILARFIKASWEARYSSKSKHGQRYSAYYSLTPREAEGLGVIKFGATSAHRDEQSEIDQRNAQLLAEAREVNDRLRACLRARPAEPAPLRLVWSEGQRV